MQASAGGPLITGKIISAEYPVNKRKYSGEVFTIKLRILAMVPVMILWRGKDILYKSEIDPGICMYKYGMNRHKNNIGVESDF